MKNRNNIQCDQNRRQLLLKWLPACPFFCVGMGNLIGSTKLAKKINREIGKPKFQKDWTRTYEESFRWRYSYYIEIMEQFAKYLGREKLIEMIKRAVDDSNVKTSPDNPQHTLRKYIKEGDEYFKNMMTWEVIEESDTVYEMKVTECLWTKIFKEKNATDIGYATVCYSDYSSPKLYHSKLKFERTKTLMKGDQYCNHRWTWNG